ncbi:MAG: dihydrolipoyl dehydrogenase [Candidatus Competibacterales bacterium]
MADIEVDIAIIGTGTAGMAAYREARKFTHSIALLEGHLYGTTCARVGCMPSKLLIAPAEARHRCEFLAEFGLRGEVPTVDGKAVMARVRAERDRFVGFVHQAVEGFDSQHKIKAWAKFVDDHTLALDDGRTLKAQRIVIATGSRPNVPPIFERAGDRLITNDEVFYWEDLPASVAVFGAGVIGLELGQALHRLGVRMRLFGKGGLVGPLTDPEVTAYAAKTFAAEYPVLFDGDVKAIDNTGDAVAITFVNEGGEEVTERFDYLLCATGRRANVDNLGLEHTSLERDPRGVPLYNTQSMQCSNGHIFIAGDANGDIPLLHEAADEGRLAGENAGRYPEVYKRARKAVLSVVFSDPQIATAGKSFRELTERGVDFAVAAVDFEDQGRARVMLMNKGLLRVYGDRETGCLLGAEMMGPHHEHLAHLLAWCIQMRMNVADILQMPFYHPVIEEGLRSALRNLLQAMDMGPQPPLRCIDCGPGG